MNLYEMTETAKQLMQLFEDGEIPEQAVNDTLESIGVNGKLEDYCKVINQFTADADCIDKEIHRLKRAKERKNKAIDRLNKAVVDYMTATNTRKTEVGTFAVSLRKSEAIEITDVTKIPEKFIKTTTKVTTAPDKTAIKKFLEEKEGNIVDGAVLVVNENLKIS